VTAPPSDDSARQLALGRSDALSPSPSPSKRLTRFMEPLAPRQMARWAGTAGARRAGTSAPSTSLHSLSELLLSSKKLRFAGARWCTAALTQSTNVAEVANREQGTAALA
jgi:hypothetical protein